MCLGHTRVGRSSAFCSMPSENLIFSDGLKSRQWIKHMHGLLHVWRLAVK